MEEQVNSYYAYLRFVALMMIPIINNIFRTEISQFNITFLTIYTAPISAGAILLVVWCLSILGTRLAAFMEKKKLSVWPLLVSVVIVWFWSVIRFR